MKSFDAFGVMIDMSRNAVMNLPALKKFMLLLSKMGYNCVMLYTEDTYEVDGEPYFGYMRGRYTKAEMKELDDYAAGLGIELIPCIQTLAHLNAVKRWKQYPFDCDDILLVDDERVYTLIEHMFDTLSSCFRSRRIHIGMDEAMNIGKGLHQKKYGPEEPFSMMKRHLERVCKLAEKHDYEVLMWSDMFFRPWNNDKYYVGQQKIPQEYIDAMPKSVTPVYWDYYALDQQQYFDMLENHKQLSDHTWFAGGCWGWAGFVPFNKFSVDTMIPALDVCFKQNVKNVIMTMWGDDGAECSHFAQLPALFYISRYAEGITDETQIKREFKEFCGIDYDVFLAIEQHNNIVPYEGKPRNPSKYMLYADCFSDFLDYTVKPGAGEQYKDIAASLYALSDHADYGYIFESAAKLADVLYFKYELGLKTRRAYEAGDKQALLALAENDYALTIKHLKAFIPAFRRQWMTDNKPHGFEVQEHRLGGLLLRLESCRERIFDYINGKIDKIEELEEVLLPFRNKEESTGIYLAPVYATTGCIHMSAWSV